MRNRRGPFWAALAVGLASTPVWGAEVCAPVDPELVARLCYDDAGGPAGYDHNIFGDRAEWTRLRFAPGPRLADAGQKPWSFAFDSGFFEDTEPRLADVTGDGQPEIIVVHTDGQKGARLVILSTAGAVVAATAHIGQYHRWLAPAGVADLDGDGQVEIAYVDRPHLRQELVILHLTGDRLTEVARVAGLTNHRIGDAEISGGVRFCAAGAEFVLLSADWRRVIVVGADLVPRDLGPAARLAAVLGCRA